VRRYSSFVPSGDQAGWPSLTLKVRVRSVSPVPSASIMARLLLPNCTVLKARRRPSGDQAGWPSSGGREVRRIGLSASSGET
jgi:hypothetical protein